MRGKITNIGCQNFNLELLVDTKSESVVDFLEYEGEDASDWGDKDEWEYEDRNDEWAYLIVDQESAPVAVERDPLYRGCLVVDTGSSSSAGGAREISLASVGDRIVCLFIDPDLTQG